MCAELIAPTVWFLANYCLDKWSRRHVAQIVFCISWGSSKELLVPLCSSDLSGTSIDGSCLAGGVVGCRSDMIRSNHHHRFPLTGQEKHVITPEFSGKVGFGVSFAIEHIDSTVASY